MQLINANTASASGNCRFSSDSRLPPEPIDRPTGRILISVRGLSPKIGPSDDYPR